MKHITTVCKCDLCGEECEPVRRLSIAVAHTGEGLVTVELKVGAHAPHRKTEDICLNCVARALGVTLGLEVEEVKQRIASRVERDERKAESGSD